MTNKSIILPNYNHNLIRALLSLKVEEREIPTLNANEVLVEMKAAPCNPSDIAFLRGGYNIIKELPAVPGFEASGIIVDTGKDVNSLYGKRISCYVNEKNNGTWTRYFKARAKECLILKEGITYEQGAGLSINPTTAWAMFDTALKAGAEAIIQNAAAGQVGQFINVLASKKGMEVINLVRKAKHVEELNKAGLGHVLDSTSENFEENFASIVALLKPSVAFDAVAGDISSLMLNHMPAGSQVLVYGGLSGAKIFDIDPMQIIFQDKSIRGFNMNKWLQDISQEALNKTTDEIQELFIKGDFNTKIQCSYPLDEVVTAIRTYIKDMSAGKILLTP